MSPHKPGFYESLLKDAIEFPLGRNIQAAPSPLLTLVRTTDPLIRNLAVWGVDGKVLWATLMRLYDLEALRPGGRKRKNLKDTLRCIEDAKRAWIRTFGPLVDTETIRTLEASAARIRLALQPWDRKEGKRKRGRSPQTRILVALMAYLLEVTGSKCWESGSKCWELSELVTASYRAAGSRGNCSQESLRKLWEYNPDLRKNWQSVLKGAWKLHPPLLGRVHVPRLRRAPGSGLGRFKPPKTRELRVSDRPKYLN